MDEYNIIFLCLETKYWKYPSRLTRYKVTTLLYKNKEFARKRKVDLLLLFPPLFLQINITEYA